MKKGATKVLTIVGTRPNIMKVAPLYKEMQKHKEIAPSILHTGQHYDFLLSEVFFGNLKIQKPQFYLNASKNPDRQLGDIITEFHKKLKMIKPDVVIVVGDVNSTFACALPAKRMGIPLAHVEAGLRSFDWTMPEEINRILTDRIADLLFVTEKSGVENLLREGIHKSKIFFVGNTMIDSLIQNLSQIMKSDICQRLRLKQDNYAVITLHRPSNVDTKPELIKILDIIDDIRKRVKLVFPIHPRTEEFLKINNLRSRLASFDNIIILKPLGYLDFMKLVVGAKFILTDSGGIQEESTYLGIPCLTMRKQTERPSTTEIGTNVVVGLKKNLVLREIDLINSNKFKKGKIPKYWDGKASERIIKIILKKYGIN